MPIEFTCSQCGTVLRTADDTAGKAARCPHCRHVEPIPARNQFSSPGNQSSYVDPFGVQPNVDFPEIRPVPTGSPFVIPQHGSAEDPVGRRVRAKIIPAAITCLVISAIVLAFWSMALLGGVASIVEKGGRGEDVLSMIFFASFVAMNFIAFVGSIRMLQMKNHKFCFVSAVCLLLAGVPCCMLPTGVGIWALIVLADPNARSFFR